MQDFTQEFDSLKTLNGMEGILLLSQRGEVIWSWQHDVGSLTLRTMRLVEMIKTVIPIMLEMPEVGVQRALFQFDYDQENISIYFRNIVHNATIACILGNKFDYINVTVEVNRVAFILSKKLSRENIEPEEMNRFLKDLSNRASLSISSAVNQFSRITKERSKRNGVETSGSAES